jgi:hypothetical protein
MRYIVYGRSLTESIKLRVSLEKRLTSTLSVLWRLVAIGVLGIVITYRLGDSEREPMLVLGGVLVKL